MWDSYLGLAVENPPLFWLILAGVAGTAALVFGQVLPWGMRWLLHRVLQDDAAGFYSRVVQPQRSLLVTVGALGILDLGGLLLLQVIWFVPWYWAFEFGVTLAFTLALGLFLSRAFQAYFDTYLLDAALKGGRKTNSEILLLGRFFANFGIIVILALLFGQTHAINIVGIVASLGVGGIAVAFAAQKVLEQLLGGVVIYIDKPFGVDEYIGLPDGTFGRVESIGLRSTKIRTSGKGTLAIVPNNVIIQSRVENFSGASKVMAIVHLNLYRTVSDEEQALIRQVVQESTHDIFGIDDRSTDISFRSLDGGRLTQVQTTLFILGSRGGSMEIRRQLLDIANQQMTQRLKTYGISFDIEDPIIYVDAPITV